MTPLLVLHRLGAPRGAAEWRDALTIHGWDGPWSAPDQPGHGTAAWECDYYEAAHLAIAPLRHLQDTDWREAPVVIGEGVAAEAAQMLALGGRASAVVLVGAPATPETVDPGVVQAAEYEWLRGIADDPDAQAPAPIGRTDPRTRHGITPRIDPDYSRRVRAAITVPVLDLEDGPPTDVLAAVKEWWAGL